MTMVSRKTIHSMAMVQSYKNHWKTIDYNGTLTKTVDHSMVLKILLLLRSNIDLKDLNKIQNLFLLLMWFWFNIQRKPCRTFEKNSGEKILTLDTWKIRHSSNSGYKSTVKKPKTEGSRGFPLLWMWRYFQKEGTAHETCKRKAQVDCTYFQAAWKNTAYRVRRA